MTGASTRIDRLIDSCRRIELAMASLYFFLAELHRDTTEIAAIWHKTAMEEENHARQFEFASKFPSLIAQEAVDAGAADELLAWVRTLEARMRADTPAPVDALRTAIGLEQSLAGYHMNCIGDFFDPRLKKVFEAMMASDKRHTQSLVEALDRLIPPPVSP